MLVPILNKMIKPDSKYTLGQKIKPKFIIPSDGFIDVSKVTKCPENLFLDNVNENKLHLDNLIEEFKIRIKAGAHGVHTAIFLCPISGIDMSGNTRLQALIEAINQLKDEGFDVSPESKKIKAQYAEFDYTELKGDSEIVQRGLDYYNGSKRDEKNYAFVYERIKNIKGENKTLTEEQKKTMLKQWSGLERGEINAITSVINLDDDNPQKEKIRVGISKLSVNEIRNLVKQANVVQQEPPEKLYHYTKFHGKHKNILEETFYFTMLSVWRRNEEKTGRSKRTIQQEWRPTAISGSVSEIFNSVYVETHRERGLIGRDTLMEACPGKVRAIKKEKTYQEKIDFDVFHHRLEKKGYDSQEEIKVKSMESTCHSYNYPGCLRIGNPKFGKSNILLELSSDLKYGYVIQISLKANDFDGNGDFKIDKFISNPNKVEGEDYVIILGDKVQNRDGSYTLKGENIERFMKDNEKRFKSKIKYET